MQAVSPHLVHIPFDHFEAAREWLEQHGPASPCAMVIASPLSLAEFEAHLKPLLRVRLPDDTPIVLACWDPSILATLAGSSEDDDLFVKGPVLSEAQRQTFFAPVLRWWYWDRHGRLRQIDWRQDEVLAESVALRPPFRLEQAQVDDLIEASVPDNLLLHLKTRFIDVCRDPGAGALRIRVSPDRACATIWYRRARGAGGILCAGCAAWRGVR